MKNVVVLVITALALLAPLHPALADEVKEGTIVTIPSRRAVAVMNLERIGNFEHQEMCLIEMGASASAAGSLEDYVLVQYLPVPGPAQAAFCPSGTFFFMLKIDFVESTARYKENAAKKIQTREFLMKLFKKSQ